MSDPSPAARWAALPPAEYARRMTAVHDHALRPDTYAVSYAVLLFFHAMQGGDGTQYHPAYLEVLEALQTVDQREQTAVELLTRLVASDGSYPTGTGQRRCIHCRRFSTDGGLIDHKRGCLVTDVAVFLEGRQL